ncbi:MAG TPA: DNA internalization-related competence protein ComEC/Rec2 [Thermoanaerobaculia bacterium]|nr:DNA internalization-related competence protein ComEC/Rec2 [Thermoanaerobaculia bacterium]
MAGLFAANVLAAPRLTIAGAICIALLALGLRSLPQRARGALITAAFAAGLAVGRAHALAEAADRTAVSGFSAGRFTTIEAPLDSDWIARGRSQLLRVHRFEVVTPQSRVAIAHRLTIYLPAGASAGSRDRALPAARIRAQGSLKLTEHGEFALTVKSGYFISYLDTVSPYTPWGATRLMATRLDAVADSQPDHAIAAGLAEALALGRGERLADEIRDSYRRGGTYHLLVFSGLQISLAAALLALLLRWLHAPRIADLSLLAFAILAPLAIGTSASVARASLAIGLYSVSRLLARPTSFENLWCVSALIRLAFVPADLIDPAFQLTYAGAGALLFLGKPLFRRLGAKGRTTRLLAGGLCAELAVAPLTLFHFHQFALCGSFLTMLMTPMLVLMLALSAAACGLVLISPRAVLPLLSSISALDRVCRAANDASADLLHLSGWFMAPPALVLVASFMLCGLALFAVRRPWRIAAAMIVLLIPVLVAIIRFQAMRSVARPRVTMLDVGQGDAILLRSGRRVVLVDGGGRMDDARFGESTLLPLLLDRGVRSIDLVMLSHAHPDHCGGLPAVVRDLDAGSVWISPRRFRGDCAQRLLDAVSVRETPLHLVRNGERVTAGDLTIETRVTDRTWKRAPDNNCSVVLQVRIAGRRVLMTGDIERETEEELLDRDSAALRADVLKVAHHGSRSSTTPRFLDAVDPRIGLISCGRGNPFGHPHSDVVSVLGARGVRVARTDRAGTIDVEIRDGHLFVQQEIDTPR